MSPYVKSGLSLRRAGRNQPVKSLRIPLREAGDGVCLGFVHVEDGIQLGEMKQVGHLSAGVGELQLPPGLAAGAVALVARFPLTLIVFEQAWSRTTRRWFA